MLYQEYVNIKRFHHVLRLMRSERNNYYMKALCVTFEAPSRKYGGGIGIIQSLMSITGFAEIDYVGPEFDQIEFPKIKINQAYFLKRSTNLPINCLNMVRGVPVRYYCAWEKLSKQLDASQYDFLFLDFSHYDFVVRWAKEHDLKVVTRVHNIEQDMSKSISKAKRFNRYKLRALINGSIIRTRETKNMMLADQLIFLTSSDCTRAVELYGEYIRKKVNIVPVCMDIGEHPEYADPIGVSYILITGSLSYGANTEGIVWFLQNVWSQIEKKNLYPGVKLVIAGSHPNRDVHAACRAVKNCILLDSPEEMAPYFEHASLYIAPIFFGAGMKVKVAEAFSYGLKVVGTTHALLGYEKADGFFFETDDADGFLKGIRQYMDTAGNKAEKEQCRRMFEKFFSLKCSRREFKNIVDKLYVNQ
jgi:glycosyltransferase involved in cell wall biosynthesis